MMRHLALACAVLAATPAFATDDGWVPPKTFNPPKDNGFQPIFNFGQQQGQQQAQQQAQHQTAIGGAGGNAAATAINQGAQIVNNLTSSSRNINVNAPTVLATGKCQRAMSAAFGLTDGGAGFGFTYDQQWCVMLEIAQQFVAMGMPARLALYTACGNRYTHKSLMLYGIACNLDGDALIAHEASYRPVLVELPKEAPRRPKARPAAPRKAPVPTPTPVDCRPTPAPVCPVS